MNEQNQSNVNAGRHPRRGAALMLCMFVMAVCSAIVIAMLDSHTLHMSGLRNTIDYERSLYLAGAAVHESLAELEADATWRDGIPLTEFPAGSGQTFSATVVDSGTDEVQVTGVGTSGGVTRQLQVTVSSG